METQIRIKAEHIVDGEVIESTLIMERAIQQIRVLSPIVGFNHEAQINAL